MNISRSSLTRMVSILAVIVILFILLNITGALKPVQSFTQRITAPISAPFYKVGVQIKSIFSKPKDLETLQVENEKLRNEILSLKTQVASLLASDQENETLRNLLDFFENDANEYKSVVTRIIGRDPENPSVLHLNAGARDGIEQGNAVIVEDGVLVAKVFEVLAQSSKALVLTAPTSQVAVSISGGSPSSKLAKGERGLSIILDQIPQQEVIKQGELVITSGLEPKIPHGLLVGEIEQIISEGNDLFQRAIMRPLADDEEIHIVSVILTPFSN